MKIKVSLVVDIDPDQWMLAYGVSRTEIHEDVQRYIENSVQAHLYAMGLLVESEQR